METNEIKNTSDDPKEVPAGVPALKQLDVFVGKWQAEGESFGEHTGGSASPENWVSEESYEWLPGGYFLLHRWDARVGSKEFTGIEIIGYDEATGTYFARMFDNMGNKPEYSIRQEDGAWIFTGTSSRATVRESIDGSTMEWKWEQQKAGGDWQPLCNRTATRLR